MSLFQKKGGSLDINSPVPVLTIRPDATSACIASRAWGAFFGLQTHGCLGQWVKCVLIWLAVSGAPQHQPQSIRRPGGRPRLAFEFLPRRSKLFTWGKAAGRFGHFVKCARIS